MSTRRSASKLSAPGLQLSGAAMGTPVAGQLLAVDAAGNVSFANRNRKTFGDLSNYMPFDQGVQITVSDTQPSWTNTGTQGTDYQAVGWSAGQNVNYTVLGGNQFTANPQSASCGAMYNVNGNGQADQAEIEFWHPGQKLCIHIPVFETDGGDFRIFIDDVPTTRKPFAVTATANYFFEFVNTTNHTKKIRISMGRAQFAFMYWQVPALPPRATTPNVKRKVGCLGDSYTGGAYDATGPGNVFEGCWHHQLVSRGFERIPMGQGGTAWINNGTGNTTYTDADATAGGATYSSFLAPRRRNAVKVQYDKGMRDLIIFGGGNDASCDPTVVANAATAGLTALLAAGVCPLLNIYVVGLQSAPFAQNADAINSALRTAVLAFPQVKVFIDQRANPWVVGSGKVTAKNNSGNADWFICQDGIHPSRDGHEWIGNLVVEALTNVAVAVL